MNTQNIEKYYTKIAEKIDCIIHEEWSKVYIYSEVLKDVVKVYFYYFSKNDDSQPIYSQNMPELFGIDENEFDMSLLHLADCFRELWQEFINNEQEPWTNITFILESNGKFKIDYDYTDLSEASPREQHIIWKYKYLGIMPKNEYGKKVIEEYIRNTESK
jgi:uncharacterized protein (TIGR01741 family)